VRRPLFWKILVGSWLSLILIGTGNALLFHVYAASVRPMGLGIIRDYGELELAAATLILQTKGPEALVDFLQRVPPQVGQTQLVSPEHLPPRPDPAATVIISRVVRTDAGPYTLIFTSFGSRFFSLPRLLATMPLQLLAVDLLAMSLLSFLIAQYLAVPIRKLAFGLKRVAEGDLTVRVSAQLRGRRDEIAELACNFDSMADRLQEALEARERLLHHLSHEFRSPLTRLQLAVDLTRQKPDRALTGLERIEQEARRLNDMVAELLSLSRADFQAESPEICFDVTELVATVAADAKFEAEAKQVLVKTELPEARADDPEQLIISGHPDLLRKAFDNVLRNAVRVSPAGGTVTLRLTVQRQKLRIEVSDDGPGVPQEDLQRMFEPFVRLKGQPEGSGFGLGLAIARSAAEAHHAVIWAANRRPHGLTVILELPN
jgi:two-component system, OmpR family, sensor kinase